MHNRFDELTKSLAQSVTRRGALKKFSVGLTADGSDFLSAFTLVDQDHVTARVFRRVRQ